MNSIHLLALLIGLVLAAGLIALLMRPVSIPPNQQQIATNKVQLKLLEKELKNFASTPSDSESWIRKLNQKQSALKAYLYKGKEIKPGFSISASGPLLQACTGEPGAVSCQNFKARVGATSEVFSGLSERLARQKASK